MDLSSGDLEGSSEDLTGKKKSKLKSLKTRLFGKTKSEVSGGERKLSQSASDVSQGRDEELDLEGSFSLGSRALSHESIFLAEQCQSSTEPPQGLSQENVPSRIKTLQMKLQQQNLRLGQPPLVMSIKRPEDAWGSSEDDGLPQSPPEIILNDVLAQRASYKQPSSPTVPITSAPSDLGVNFDTPAQFTPCLDNSAARHRMSVKPRNQRASAKVRKLTSQPASRTRSESMNSLEHPVSGGEDEKGVRESKEPIRFRSTSTQVLQTGESPAAHRDENHLPTSNHGSLKESGITHQPPTPLQPPVQPRPVMTEATVMKSTLHSQPLVTKDQEPPVASVCCSGTKSPVGDPRSNNMAPEIVGTKPPASAKIRSGSSTRQVGESLGIYPLKPAPTSAPSTAVAQDISAGIPTNKEMIVSGSQMAVLQNKTEMADKRGTVNPQAEIRPKVQSMTVHGISGSLVPGATQIKFVSNNEIASVKGQGESGMFPQLAKGSTPKQTDKPQIVENIATVQHRPTSASPRFTISSAYSKDQTKTGNFTSTLEETGAKKYLTKPNFPHQSYQPQELCDIQKGDMKAKELPPTTPVEIPFEGNVEPKLLQQVNSSGPESLNLPHEMGEEATEDEGQDVVEEAVEACEDLREPGEEEPVEGEGEKNAFGVKLRSTSLSLKYKFDSSQTESNVKCRSADVSTLSTAQGSQAVQRTGRSRSLIKPATSPCSESLAATPAGQDIPSLPSAYSTGGKLRSRSLRQEGEASQSTVAHHPKNASMPSPSLEGVSAGMSSAKVTSSTSPSSSAPLPSKEVGLSQPADASPTPVKEPEATSSDFSWMSMAMEKTRTIHQLFSSKLPDFPEGPTLSGVPQAKKELIPSPVTEGAPVPSPSVKTKSASSPTKQMPSAPLSSKITAPPQSNNLTSTAAPTAKEPEMASSDVSWMSVAMEKTRNLQQLFTSISPEFTGPQAATKTTHTIETQPPVLTRAARSAQSTISEKTSAQSTRVSKQTAPPDASPTLTSQSSTTGLHSRPGQTIPKPQPVAESSSKPAPTTSSQSPVTQTIIRGTSLRASQPVATQPNIVSSQLAKLAQSQQTTAQSVPLISPINKTQPSPSPSSVQAITRPSPPSANSHLSSSPKPPSHLKQQSQPAPPSTSHSTANSHLSSSPKPPSHLKQQSQPAPPSTSHPTANSHLSSSPKPPSDVKQQSQPAPPSTSHPTANSHLSSSPKPPSHVKQQSQPAPPSTSQGSNDGLYSLKKSGDFPQPATGRGSGANVAPEIWGPRTSGLSSKAAFLEKWADKGASAGTKFEASKATSETQSSPGFFTSVRPGYVMRDSGTDTDSVPSTIPSRATEDRPLKKTLVASASSQQPVSDGGQPSWMEMAKRKSLAWSDKSMD